MNEPELITEARHNLNAAETAWRYSQPEEYTEHMQHLLVLLIGELLNLTPKPQTRKDQKS